MGGFYIAIFLAAVSKEPDWNREGAFDQYGERKQRGILRHDAIRNSMLYCER